MFTTPGDRVARLRQSYTIGGVARRSPSTVVLRETLTANRTYYVRTDGSDGNTGLSNSSGGAFLTINKAVQVALALDLSLYTVTIQVGNGTYTGAVTFASSQIGGQIIIQGDTTTPTNVVWHVTSGTCVTFSAQCDVIIQGFQIRTTTSGDCILVNNKTANVGFGNMNFGTSAGMHIRCNYGRIYATANYTISGNASFHILATLGGVVEVQFFTVTVSGTPAFSGYFVASASVAIVTFYGTTISGSATGTRYYIELGGVIQTNGGGANFFPGNVAGSGGTTAGGGFYN